MRFVNYKILLGGALVLILVIIIKNVTGRFLEIRENGSVVDKLKKELREEENRNKFLKERLKYVQTDEFIEEESRKKLGLVKKGEVVVQEAFESSKEHSIEKKLNPPNWKQWLDLFL